MEQELHNIAQGGTSQGGLLGQLHASLLSGAVKVVDLTFPLSPDFPVIVLPPEFGQCAPFRRETVSRYDADGPAWYWNNISMNEHTGTHFDAPAHWITGRDIPRGTVDSIDPARFLAPAVVMDFSAEAAANEDFILTADHIRAWETKNGQIPPKHWVFFRTDWSKRAGTPSYLNLRDDGAHSPGPDASAMEFLVHERDAVGFGVETVGTDAGQASHFDPPLPAHAIMHGNGRFGLQCMCNLDQLPTFGTMIVATPLKIEAGSGSPLRVIALVE